MVFVKVYKKYTVVIPKKIREALGIKAGDTIEVRQDGEKIVLFPVKRSEKAVEKTHGVVKWEKTIDEGIEEGYRKIEVH